ncbi:MAG TPA: hypothetical protein PLA02_01970 [Brevefilum fermentans]|jgi:SMC interacting uncharacterized protein involved in chromosome segregation|uniref:Uncharacterized protein n=1 Tax=Candidatus Brevifilum fermentans TaxID=1986204 RepID=A0A1Y6K5I5_9CHLR|nr:hypothetical protein [Brevefilum fermentans]OQB87891.1 MAG: hypothetical protein BWX85_00183 [Chloroflexi bacterium ADurb.Bin120]SMX54107.1 conserved protein of unknown function [Brevefilum fermentans]HOM67702.1 hypothetical protein [Brevefilum fermentans]HQA27967.1 hypothetical protein [Brevefilum fermentans]
MSDILSQVTGQQDFLKKILAKIPGFKGYIERGDRRMSDKLLREKIADEFDTLNQRVSSLQREMVDQGELAAVGSLENAAIKLRQFTDRIRTASYGYAGIFDAIKIKEEQLDQVYQYDYALLELSESVASAIDNVETSIGTEGQDAAIRHLVTVSQQCVDAFNKRTEVMQGIAD